MTRLNALKKQNLKLVNKCQGKPPRYEEIFNLQTRDLVFVCSGGEQLEYHSQVILNLSRTLTDILENERLFRNFFLPSDFKLYVTMDGISASTVEAIMETIYKCQDLKCLRDKRDGIQDFLEALGITDKFYTIIEEENDEAIVNVISDLINDFDVPVLTRSNTPFCNH